MRKFIPKSTGWVWFFLAAFRPTGTKEEVCRESRSAQFFLKKRTARRYATQEENSLSQFKNESREETLR